jgi:phosphoribosylformylglycinamidine synthase
LAQLVRANQALYEICTTYGVPCISGKDSMKNDATIGGIKISIPPTLLFSVVSRIQDVRLAVTMDAKHPGDLVYVLGTTYPELGASEYHAMYNYIGNIVPKVRMKEALARYRALSDAICQGFVSSCHDCSDGGLGISLAEVAFSGDLGMVIDLGAVIVEDVERLDTLLFSESQSRFVVTVGKEYQQSFEDTMRGTGYAVIGEVIKKPVLTLEYSGKIVVNDSLDSLKDSWKSPLAW